MLLRCSCHNALVIWTARMWTMLRRNSWAQGSNSIIERRKILMSMWEYRQMECFNAESDWGPLISNTFAIYPLSSLSRMCTVLSFAVLTRGLHLLKQAFYGPMAQQKDVRLQMWKSSCSTPQLHLPQPLKGLRCEKNHNHEVSWWTYCFLNVYNLVCSNLHTEHKLYH